MKDTLKKNLKILIILNGSLLLSAVAYLIFFLATDKVGIPCIIKEGFGFYCPSCGGSRALLALFRLDIYTSFIYYPPLIISALVILDYDIRLVITLIKRRSKYADNFKFYSFLIIPISVIVWFILRNILLFSFGIDTLGDFI